MPGRCPPLALSAANAAGSTGSTRTLTLGESGLEARFQISGQPAASLPLCEVPNRKA